MKAVVAAFNQEKALVGAFSVIVKTGYGSDGSICGTNQDIELCDKGTVSLPRIFLELMSPHKVVIVDGWGTAAAVCQVSPVMDISVTSCYLNIAAWCPSVL